MNGKIAIAIIILLLAVFFYPKDAGSTCGFCPGPPLIEREEYGCMGFKKDISPGPNCLDCGTRIVCYGMVTSEKKCYTNINGGVEVPNCKNPGTWQEIISICPGCYSQASIAAYNQNDLAKAIELCNLMDGPQQKNNCILGIAREAIYRNRLSDAENICANNLTSSKDTCLREIAEKIAESDIEQGVSACGRIEPSREKDNCYHNVAVKARPKNMTRALEICGMIEEDISTPPCRELIQKYCEIYNC